ncbi:MAG: hypothetical protein ACREJ2_03020 [Planctomycetota bacterium]
MALTVLAVYATLTSALGAAHCHHDDLQPWAGTGPAAAARQGPRVRRPQPPDEDDFCPACAYLQTAQPADTPHAIVLPIPALPPLARSRPPLPPTEKPWVALRPVVNAARAPPAHEILRHSIPA